MAGTKVKDLTLKSVLSSTDEFYINDVENGNLDKKTTVGDINNFILPIAISDVTSLQTALDGKSATGHTHVLADITDVTITAINLNILDDGVNTTLHFHDSDRARANHTGTQLKATISDFAHTHPLSEISDVTASAAEVNILDGATLSVTELNYVDGVTSAIQTQLDTKITASSSDTLTNKSISLTTNTVTGTKTEFNTALSDDNFAFLGTGNVFTATQTIPTLLVTTAASIGWSTYQGTSALDVAAASSGNAVMIFTKANDTGGTDIRLRRTGGTLASPTGTLASNNTKILSQLSFQGYDPITPAFFTSAYIRAIADEDWSGTAAGTHLEFATTKSTTQTLSEKFRVTGNGDIAIASTFRLYLDGVAGTGNDYLEATSNNNILLNGATTVALGVAGSNVFSATSSAITLTGTVAQSGKTVTYNNINTAGIGTVPVVASFIGSSSSGSQSNIINYTPPSTAGTYRILASIANTSGTNTGTTTITITYKDAAGNSVTFLPPFSQTGSATLLTACTGASKNFSIVGHTFSINNAGTAITVSTTVTGTVAYFVNAVLEQLA